jgi:hypothetical protein
MSLEKKRNGWILMEGNKIVSESNGAILVFKTKDALFAYFGGALGDINRIKKVKIINLW